MRRIILLLVALGLAVSARADVSDSGNLTIGGTGVIQGTMTVQGAAFSVGGTTFSVAGGSITLGGRLNAAAAGIKWADGTTSTTASSGGGGNVLLTATQTFSGANTFANAVTFSSAVYGAYVEVASAAVSAATSYTFDSSVVSSSAAYRIEYDLTQNTSVGYLGLVVNGITTNYRWVIKIDCDNTDPTQFASTSDTYIRLHGYQITVGRPAVGQINITQTQYPSARVVTNSRGEDVASVIVCTQTGSGTLASMSGLTSIKLQTGNGAFTGTIKLYRRWDK